MEIRVYDRLNRKVARAVTAAMVAGMLAAYSAMLLVSPQRIEVPLQAYPVFILPVLMIVLVIALLDYMASARIRIERATGEVVRLSFLFGREVRRQRFNLSDFDRVSLSRGFRAGYQVSLVGRDRDLTVLLTSKLETARDQAEKVAAECALKMSDQL